MKLKDHRLKPGGVFSEAQALSSYELKHHRLKPGGVSNLEQQLQPKLNVSWISC